MADEKSKFKPYHEMVLIILRKALKEGGLGLGNQSGPRQHIECGQMYVLYPLLNNVKIPKDVLEDFVVEAIELIGALFALAIFDQTKIELVKILEALREQCRSAGDLVDLIALCNVKIDKLEASIVKKG